MLESKYVFICVLWALKLANTMILYLQKLEGKMKTFLGTVFAKILYNKSANS